MAESEERSVDRRDFLKIATSGTAALVANAQSGVAGSLAAGKIYFGTPAEDAITKKRELVWVKRIPEIWEKLKNNT
jgi:UDP-3-O-[3-hydroxymyristoyl] glucosamine N-acyltransferase